MKKGKTFGRRGFLEGFYGRPWTDAQRRGMIELMAGRGMNVYAYAAKDDPYHRDAWEELYPPEALAQLGSLAAFCREKGVDFMYCTAPGLTFEYDNPAHYAALRAKLEQVMGLGVTSFGLFFDDIPADRQSPGDHAKVAKALCGAYPHISLTVCPMVYHGTGREQYIRRLGRALPKKVDIFWTGRNICSQEITVEEAKRFQRNTGHMPLYWDNYPVNDAEMYHEMHLGPIEGRAAGLYKHCRGILFNTMEYFECTKLPLLTCADYLRDPERYGPDWAWMDALNTLFGKDAPRVAPFAEQCMTSCLKAQNGPRMMEAIEQAATLQRTGELPEALGVLRAYYARMEDCRAFLAESGHPMIPELKKWVKKYNLCCEIFGLALRLLTGHPVREELESKMEAYNESGTVLTEFGFRAFVEKVLEMGPV
ncbi:MAG: beta-N-acetylglucosaminidase domain-containing protein [Oscillospiraceae bacterium]|jgi:hyaluronoglucosaminidase|nr:beta-N-acetylglucosaminidase domain-containing protein [Oscillospiraceae bacterium]